VLDLGCGTGLATSVLSRWFDVIGVDFSGACIRMARRAAPGAAFVHADMTEVAFRPASFDGVTAFYSLIHVPREEHGAVLASVARWLRPGGTFLANFGIGDSPGGTEDDWCGVPMYWSSYGRAGTERLVRDAGLRILSSETVTQVEDEKSVTFLWILARRTA
jgi:SAM-dependent methyltransferase